MAEPNRKFEKCDEIMEYLFSGIEPESCRASENTHKASSIKANVKKRKKDLDRENLKSNQGVKKQKESTKDRVLKWNSFYSDKSFGIWIQCTKCNKWRKEMEYEEEHEVPKDWCCSMSTSGTRECDAPEDIHEEFSPVNFIPGSIVWAKFTGYPWWPGMIEIDPDTEEYYWKEHNGKCCYNVTFLDDKVSHAWVSASFVRPYLEPPKQQHPSASYFKYRPWIAAADAKAKEAIKMSIKERLQNFSFVHKYKGKWGPALNLDVTDEDENKNDVTQMLLEEICDIESIESSESGRSASSFELQKNQTDNKSDHCEISSKDNSVNSSKYKKNLTSNIRNKLPIETQSKNESKPINEDDATSVEPLDVGERKLLNKLINEANDYIDTVKPNTEEEKKDSKISGPQKRKGAKSAHLKLMKDEISRKKDDIAISLELADKKNLTVSSKTTLVKTSKMKNKKSDKFENLTEKMDNTKENEEGKKSNTKKKHMEDTKKMNEITKGKAEKILNNSSKTKFKPPKKTNKNDTCEANQSYKKMNEEKIKAETNLQSSGSITKQEKNIVKKELSEKNLKENKRCNKTANTKYSTTEKIAPKNAKNMKSNKSVKKYAKSENNLEKDDTKMIEKILKRFDDNRDEEIPCNKDSNKENVPISFEITGQQSEDEDSDPFEAE